MGYMYTYMHRSTHILTYTGIKYPDVFNSIISGWRDYRWFLLSLCCSVFLESSIIWIKMELEIITTYKENLSR